MSDSFSLGLIASSATSVPEEIHVSANRSAVGYRSGYRHILSERFLCFNLYHGSEYSVKFLPEACRHDDDDDEP